MANQLIEALDKKQARNDFFATELGGEFKRHLTFLAAPGEFTVEARTAHVIADHEIKPGDRVTFTFEGSIRNISRANEIR